MTQQSTVNRTDKIKNIATSKDKIENYVIMPRQIINNLHNGILTPAEFSVLCYIRLSGNPYGVATISLENIRNDILRGTTISYCNKILLSLKSKRCIYYEPRSGRRGSFHVELGDWKLPNKLKKTLDKFFDTDTVRGYSVTITQPESEVNQNLTTNSQRSESSGSASLQSLLAKKESTQFRGANNDKDTNNDMDIYRYKKSLIPLEDFEPESLEESRCLEIAQWLGETTINPILTLLKDYGLNVIERAYGTMKEDLSGKAFVNKPAYFQSVVKSLGKKKSAENYEAAGSDN